MTRTFSCGWSRATTPSRLRLRRLSCKRGAWVPQLALAEATWVLSAVCELDGPEIATAVEMLLNHRDLTLEGAEVVGDALEIYRKRPALGFSDCLMLEAARKAGHLPLGTFDRSLGKLEGTETL